MALPLTRADYGLDAPGLARMFWGIGGAAIVVGLAVNLGMSGLGLWRELATAPFALAAAYFVFMGSLMLFESKVTKLRVRDRLLDSLVWRGDERVLDVGCGRGLMAIGAAHRAPKGEITGVDIWRQEDQSANSAEAFFENARLEGVAERVRVETADMRSLPFADAAFDVILSHWAVHNLDAEAERDRALAEMARVLKPDGVIVLVDIQHREAYRRQLAKLGLSDQKVVVSKGKDAVLNVLSFGSYRPAAIIARR